VNLPRHQRVNPELAVTVKAMVRPELTVSTLFGENVSFPSPEGVTVTVEETDHALERAWTHRDRWKQLGAAAKGRAQEFVRSDPVGEFVESLKRMAARSQAKKLVS